jgi:hypothetical protein
MSKQKKTAVVLPSFVTISIDTEAQLETEKKKGKYEDRRKRYEVFVVDPDTREIRRFSENIAMKLSIVVRNIQDRPRVGICIRILIYEYDKQTKQPVVQVYASFTSFSDNQLTTDGAFFYKGVVFDDRKEQKIESSENPFPSEIAKLTAYSVVCNSDTFNAHLPANEIAMAMDWMIFTFENWMKKTNNIIEKLFKKRKTKDQIADSVIDWFESFSFNDLNMITRDIPQKTQMEIKELKPVKKGKKLRITQSAQLPRQLD